jgi:hypothetical protein
MSKNKGILEFWNRYKNFVLLKNIKKLNFLTTGDLSRLTIWVQINFKTFLNINWDPYHKITLIARKKNKKGKLYHRVSGSSEINTFEILVFY